MSEFRNTFIAVQAVKQLMVKLKNRRNPGLRPLLLLLKMITTMVRFGVFSFPPLIFLRLKVVSYAFSSCNIFWHKVANLTGEILILFVELYDNQDDGECKLKRLFFWPEQLSFFGIASVWLPKFQNSMAFQKFKKKICFKIF